MPILGPSMTGRGPAGPDNCIPEAKLEIRVLGPEMAISRMEKQRSQTQCTRQSAGRAPDQGPPKVPGGTRPPTAGAEGQKKTKRPIAERLVPLSRREN